MGGEGVVQEEMCYTNKELNESANPFRRKSWKFAWEWILRVLDNGG